MVSAGCNLTAVFTEERMLIDPIVVISSAIMAGSLKRLTEAGYNTTDAIFKKLSSFASSARKEPELIFQKTRDFNDIEQRLRSIVYSKDEIDALVDLSIDLISTLDDAERKRLLSTSDKPIYKRLFDDIEFTQSAFSGSIQRQYGQIDEAVECLTTEQFRVMRVMDPVARAHITGSPGSGKTLIAAEKGIRLARGGRKVLTLCHSPNLCSHIQNLIGNNQVEVDWFVNFCKAVLGKNDETDWTHYHNLTDHDYQQTLERISKQPIGYDAVIVDEAQDFEERWWDIVLNITKNDDAKMYIFSDERQSLIPGRGHYPDFGDPFDMSRNCRNSGAVFEYMKQYDTTLPDADPLLKDLGYVDDQQASEVISKNLERGLRSAQNYDLLNETVVLFGSGYDKFLTTVNDTIIKVDDQHLAVWRYLVIKFLNHVVQRASRDFGSDYRIIVSDRAKFEISTIARRLSYDVVPNSTDRAIIAAACSLIKFKNPDIDYKNRQLEYLPTGFSINHYGDLALAGANYNLQWDLKHFLLLRANIRYFADEDWNIELGSNFEVRLTMNALRKDEGVVPVFRLEDYKGLEAHCVILFPDRYASDQSDRRSLVGASRARKILIVFGRS